LNDLDPIPAAAARRRRGSRVTTLMAVVLACGVLFGSLARSVRQAREAARASQCVGNFKQIALALANYHSAFDCFPPAYVADATGKPMHSWRVLILPFLEQSVLYNAYDFAEPWDGPNNRLLIDRIPSPYNCPSRGAGRGLTSYVAIVGPDTAFPHASIRKSTDIRDGTSRTILGGEVSNIGIVWTEPRDLDVATMSWAIDDPARPGLSSFHDRGPAVAFVDGYIRRLGTFRPPGTLKALTTIDGGEPVDLDKGP